MSLLFPAKIVGINSSKGKAVAYAEIEYVLLELSEGDEFEMHDEIITNFDFHDHGDGKIAIASTGKVVDVYVNGYCGQESAQKWLHGS